MKQCGQCRKTIDTQARTCPYCQSRFTDEEMAQSVRLSRTRGAVVLAIALGIGVILVKSCGL